MMDKKSKLDEYYTKLDKQHIPMDEDKEYINALEFVVGEEYIGISDLQKNLKIGYARAGAYMDDFEYKGYVAKNSCGNKRKVLLTKEQFNEKYRK